MTKAATHKKETEPQPVALPRVSESYYNAHEVIKGDPAIDGPYLDDINAEREEIYRKNREAEEEARAAAVAEEEASSAEEKKTESKEKTVSEVKPVNSMTTSAKTVFIPAEEEEEDA